MTVYGLFEKQDKELIMLVLFKDIERARERLALIKRTDEKATTRPNLYTADLDTSDHYREWSYKWESKTDGTPTKHLLAVRFEVYIKALTVEEN